MSAPAFDSIWASRFLSLIPVADAVYTLFGWLFYDRGDRNNRDRGIYCRRITLIISCLILDILVFMLLFTKNHQRLAIPFQTLASIFTQERERLEATALKNSQKSRRDCCPVPDDSWELSKFEVTLGLLISVASVLLQIFGLLTAQLLGINLKTPGFVLSQLGAGIGWVFLFCYYSKLRHRLPVRESDSYPRMPHVCYVVASGVTACVAPMPLVIGILHVTLGENNFISTTLNGIQLCAFSTFEVLLAVLSYFFPMEMGLSRDIISIPS